MTKFTKRILLAVTASLFTVSTVFFAVSCKKEKNDPQPEPEAATYRLTLDYDGGSEAENPVFDVQAGTSIKTYLDENVPAPISGLAFSTWYIAGAEVPEGFVMPEEEVVVTAKYLTTYYVDGYVKLDSGFYASAGEPQLTDNGKAMWKAPFDYVNTFNGYRIETSIGVSAMKLHSDSLQIAERFKVFLDPYGHEITFRVGDSSMTTLYEHDDFTCDVWFGEELTFPDGKDFGPKHALHFEGWSRTDGGNVVYHAGEKIVPESDTTYYAVWTVGYVDFFGGYDALFINTTDETKVTLVRSGISDTDEQVGEYNKESGIVTFDRGAKDLVGKIVDSEFFFWIKDLAGHTFDDGLGTGDKLRFDTEDKVTYQPFEKADVPGKLTIDLDTGEYIFKADEGDLKIIFNITQMEMPVAGREGETELKQVYLSATDRDLRGFYAYADGNSVDQTELFFLDGVVSETTIIEEYLGEDEYYHEVERTVKLGGFRAYSYVSGRLVYHYQGFYYCSEEGTEDEPAVYAFLRGTDTAFYFRIEDYSGNVGKYNMKGKIRLSDGLDGTYSNYTNTYAGSLELDGFGGGKYKGEDGTYTIVTRDYTFFSSSEGRYTWTDEWLVFNYATGGSTLIRFVSGGYEGIFYEEMTSEPHMIEWAYSPARNYSTFVMLGDLSGMNGAFYTYTDDAYYLLVWYNDVYTNETVYELIDAGTIRKEATSDRTLFRFQSGQFEVEYYFFLNDEGKVETRITNGEQSFGDDVSIDEDGKLTFYGAEYAYGDYGYASESDQAHDDPEFTLWVFYEIRHVQYGSTTEAVRGDTLGYILQKDDTFTKINKLYPIILREYPGQSDGFYYLFFLDETHVAIGGFTDNSGSSRGFILQGTRTNGDGDTFVFNLGNKAQYEELETTWPGIATFLDEENDKYTFTAKLGTYSGTESYIVEEKAIDFTDPFHDAEEKETLTLDAYGGATYQAEGGDPTVGTYEYLGYRETDTENYHFIRFIPNDSSVTPFFFKLFVNGDEEGSVTYFVTVKDKFETGIWYWMITADDGITYYPENFAMFFGDGTAFDTTGWGDMTYEEGRTNVDFSGYSGNEFEVTYAGEGGVPVTATVLLFNFGGVNCIVIRNAQTQEFVVENTNGGYVRGDGYLNSSYSNGSTIFYGNYLRVNYDDRDPDSFDGRDWMYGYELNWESGNVVIFVASAQLSPDGNDYIYVDDIFFFDVMQGNRLSLRDDYSGARFLYENGAVTEKKIYLDGHGNAEMYDAGGTVISKGRYSYLGGTEFVYYNEQEEEAMHFSIAYLLISGDKVLTVYYDLSEHHVYVADDWSVLILHAFDPDTANSGEYIDQYGVSLSGLFLHVGNSIVKFTAENGSIYYFKTDGEASFTAFTDDFVVEDGVLYGYQGKTYWNQEEFKIPDDVTRISSYVFGLEMYFASCTLNLNNVLIIDDYAFYNVSNLGFTSIESEKVTEIGAYAFYVSGGQYLSDGVTRTYSSVISLSFPNVTKIGDYAFANNNMLRLGSIYLEKIQEIGDHAFMINRTSAENERCTLDLTKANIANLTIHKDAFAYGPGTYSENTQLGYAFRILLSAEGYAEAEKKWKGTDDFNEIFKCIFAETSDSLHGKSFYSFADKEYIVFTDTASTGAKGFYDVTYYKETGSTKNEKWGIYRTVKDGTRTIVELYTVEGGVQSIARFTDETGTDVAGYSFSVSDMNKTFYEVNKKHTVRIVESSDSFPLVFTLSVNDPSNGGEITATLSAVTYNGTSVNVEVKKGSEVVTEQNAYKRGVRFCFTLTDEHYTYSMLVDPDIGSARRNIVSAKFDVDGGNYQVEFGAFNGNAPTELTALRKKNSVEGYNDIVKDGHYKMTVDVDGTYASVSFDILVEAAKLSNFTVTYRLPIGETAVSVEVKETEYVKKRVNADDGESYVDFFCTEGDESNLLGIMSIYMIVDYDSKTYNLLEEPKGWELVEPVVKNGNTFTVSISEEGVVKKFVIVYDSEKDQITISSNPVES